jgi:hypothetical protein
MSNENRHNQDEALLIDFLMGHCDTTEQQAIADRLEADSEFAKLHQDLANTLAAIQLDPQPQAPDDLVARTMGHIASQTELDSLLTQQADGRDRSARRTPRQWVTAAAIVVLLMAAVLPWVSKFNTGTTITPPPTPNTAGLYDPANPKFEQPAPNQPLIMIVPRLAEPEQIEFATPQDDAPDTNTLE